MSTSTFGFMSSDLLAGALQLGAADVGGAVDDLALQVRVVDDVEVDDADRPDPGGREVQRERAAQAAGPDGKTLAALSCFCPSMATSGMIRCRL